MAGQAVNSALPPTVLQRVVKDLEICPGSKSRLCILLAPSNHTLHSEIDEDHTSTSETRELKRFGRPGFAPTGSNNTFEA